VEIDELDEEEETTTGPPPKMGKAYVEVPVSVEVLFIHPSLTLYSLLPRLPPRSPLLLALRRMTQSTSPPQYGHLDVVAVCRGVLCAGKATTPSMNGWPFVLAATAPSTSVAARGLLSRPRRPQDPNLCAA
jgi:hypothetical protein